MPGDRVEFIREELRKRLFVRLEMELTDEDIRAIIDADDDWRAMTDYGADE